VNGIRESVLGSREKVPKPGDNLPEPNTWADRSPPAILLSSFVAIAPARFYSNPDYQPENIRGGGSREQNN